VKDLLQLHGRKKKRGHGKGRRKESRTKWRTRAKKNVMGRRKKARSLNLGTQERKSDSVIEQIKVNTIEEGQCENK